MIIDNHEIPNELITRYCAIIKELENGFSPSFESARKELHNRIFKAADCSRSLYRRTDREFSKALNEVVIDLTT